MEPGQPIPRLESERLILRAFCLYDVNIYFKLISEPKVLQGTDMPHPMDVSAIREWILSHSEYWKQRKDLFLLLTNKKNREILGSISLFTYEVHQKAEMGYWIAAAHWGKGYATEGCKTMLDYAFNTLNLHRMEANHLARNPQSGRVLEKVGFKYEGLHPDAYLKDGTFEDLMFYGLLKKDFQEFVKTLK